VSKNKSFLFIFTFIFLFVEFDHNSRGAIKNVGENIDVREWLELVSLSLVEFVLELDPMKTEGMQEALEQVHAHEDGERNRPEDWPQNDTLYKNKLCKNVYLPNR
jgi:hypothetical protein